MFGLLVLASNATATNPSGVNMRWTQCAGDGGPSSKVFACNSNVGVDRMVCSFVSATPIADVSGAEFTLDIRTDSNSLPLWWQFKNIGTCRNNALGMNVIADPAAIVCEDAWSGQAFGGIGAYNIGQLAPNMARIRAAAAVPQAALLQVAVGIEYFTANFTVNHLKTVGLGACTGCKTPACILFAELVITTAVAANNRVLNVPKDGNNSNWIGWQGGAADTPRIVCDTNGCNYEFGCSVPPVSVRPSTWGAVKSLYR